MKIIQPKPFTFQAGPRAVLLLHGFTGHSADVRMIGRYLEKKGYSSHAPIYRGHGLPPEELVKTSAGEWWEDVLAAYQHLQDLGYQEIAVAGLSLGGVLGLKLAYSVKIKAVIPMCAPMFFDNEDQLTAGFKHFVKQYKQLEGKDEQTIAEEMNTLMATAPRIFREVEAFVKDVKDHIDMVYTPTMVVQARKDRMINPDSANYIYEHVQADHKQMKWYEKSGHLITFDVERDQLHEDIYEFLESLDWEE